MSEHDLQNDWRCRRATIAGDSIDAAVRQLAYRALAVLWAAVAFSACSAPEVLEPRTGEVPDDVDLSGDWILRTDHREDEERLREAIRRTDGVDERDLYRRPSGRSASANRSRSSGKVKGGLVYVFLETGTSLRVSQTDAGLFISFDRAVVEEYRFGERRIVSVGQVQAQRVTGWEGRQLVVETLGRNGMKMTERYRLLNDGGTMERSITLRSREGEQETIVQLFERRAT